jgi:hypothetical protein
LTALSGKMGSRGLRSGTSPGLDLRCSAPGIDRQMHRFTVHSSSEFGAPPFLRLSTPP